MEKAIAAKGKDFKAWKTGKGTRVQPNAFPDMQCTLLIKKPTRRPTRILTLSLQKSTALLTSRGENTDVDGGKLVKNDAGEMSMSEDSKVEGLVRALPKASQC